MKLRTEIAWLSLPILVQAANVSSISYRIPSAAPSSAAKLAPAPVGLSFEFFEYPSYFTDVTATKGCLSNFQTLSGTFPPIRIGGTTQDRAVYDTNILHAYVIYEVASPADAPNSLTFGPNFLKLASLYSGTVVLGLNRGHDNISNAIEASKEAKDVMGNLRAIELGNEPEYYANAGQPIASSIWGPAVDAASQNDWIVEVGTELGCKNVIQAGNSNASPPSWGAAELIASINETAEGYVKSYSHHNYPGGSLQSLMSHKGIVRNLEPFGQDGKAANAVGKEYVLGETNSATGGGAASVSPTFGAAIWTLDYALQATTLSISTIYYHQGTIGNCQYCWWGHFYIGAPYYGAWLAATAFAGSSYIQQIDDGTSNYGIYVLYDKAKVPVKAVLINSDYFDGTGTRGEQTFSLGGLTAGKQAKAKRLTAGSALSRVDQGDYPKFGEQVLAQETCAIQGNEVFERASVDSKGTVSFTIAASEALLVYF